MDIKELRSLPICSKLGVTFISATTVGLDLKFVKDADKPQNQREKNKQKSGLAKIWGENMPTLKTGGRFKSAVCAGEIMVVAASGGSTF